MTDRVTCLKASLRPETIMPPPLALAPTFLPLCPLEEPLMLPTGAPWTQEKKQNLLLPLPFIHTLEDTIALEPE